MSAICICRLMACLFIASTARASGILVFRSDRGLQFTDAVTVLINGKDKALSLGSEPKINGPIGKLQAVRLSGSS